MCNTDSEYTAVVALAEKIACTKNYELSAKLVQEYAKNEARHPLNSKAGLIIRLLLIFAYSENKQPSLIADLLPSTAHALRQDLIPSADTSVMIMFLRRVSAKHDRLSAVLSELGLRTGTIDIAPSKVSPEIRRIFSGLDAGIAQVFLLKPR